MGAEETNYSDGCIKNYDPHVDYFPEKVAIQYATGFTVEYHRRYKIVRVLDPQNTAKVLSRYVLVQCGAPIPEGFEKAQIIEVPIKTLISLSTAQLPHLDLLGVSDKLIGFSSFHHVNNSIILRMIKEGRLTEVGENTNLKIETVLDLRPDLVMTFGTGDPETDTHSKLLEVGLKIVLDVAYIEKTPLGQSEWIKFTALFFNKEATAQEVFDQIASRYKELATLARDVPSKPTVFAGIDYGGVWYIPGGRSYVATFLVDAGANYVWSDDLSTGNLHLSFESVLDKAAYAEFWISVGTWRSIKDALVADERYTSFTALKNGKVFTNNARVNEYGGNDYWESGVVNPHLVLADLIKIFHPDLLPEHQLIWYRRLE
jgi:iron complex transport system substrate-binding protein